MKEGGATGVGAVPASLHFSADRAPFSDGERLALLQVRDSCPHRPVSSA